SDQTGRQTDRRFGRWDGSLLEAREITVSYGTNRALDGVSCELAPGEVVAVIGPNGAGKSTLLAALSGVMKPGQGAVLIDGEAVKDLSPEDLALRRAALEQTPVKDLPYTTETLVGLTIPTQIAPSDAREIVNRALLAVDLDEIRKIAVHRLSGGQAHRAHLARALAQLWSGQALGYGRYLMIDEPTASLDLQHQRNVLDVVRTLRQEGTGVLIVLHDLTLAAAIADRVLLMRAGRVVIDAAPDDVIQPSLIEPVYETPIVVVRKDAQMIVAPDYRAGTAQSS
ncbi:MAG: ATP-binding cassette domain-containing protein, partial [Pseudomonadota bacterium]